MGFPLDTATEVPQAVSKVARTSTHDSVLALGELGLSC